jgi:serine protease 16
MLPPDQWFNQTLDHANPLNIGFWQQRYWTNASFWSGAASGAPVVLYLEGEGAGSAVDVVSGQHVELAAGYGALVVALEHRYFGASVPTADLTLANMGYLSSHQALGDVSRFITEYLVPTYGLNLTRNKVITFGGSYPGALSAWARLRLPHLISFAFSTSSPVEAQLDFSGYCGVVAAALANPAVGGSAQCLDAVTAAFAQIDGALRGNSAAQSAMAKRLYSCAAPASLDDVKMLASNAAGVLMGIVQYNAEVPGPTVASVCSQMTAAGADPVDTFAQVLLETIPGQACMDNSYSDFISGQAGNTTADPTATGVG